MPRLIFILLISTLLGARSADPAAPTRQGKDFALFFAVDTYEDTAWTDLNNPVRDAEAIAEELETHFGFETEIHKNPTLEKIYDVVLNWQEKQFSDDAQLFIFFSGHGAVNDFDNEGYFMPTDAAKRIKNHLSLLSLRQAINRIPCPHILLAVDACYSGTILQKGDDNYRPAPRRLGETAETRRNRVISTELTYPSRYIMTSGGRERTLDGKYHSPFTEGILNALSGSLREEGLAVWSYMVYQMESEVKNPRPRFGTFDGHRNGGGFVFVRNKEGFQPRLPSSTKPFNPMDQIPIPNMIEIPEGIFEMGSNKGHPNEKPIHSVKVSRFELAETEITNFQYCAFLNANRSQKEGEEIGTVIESEYPRINNIRGQFVPEAGYGDYPAVMITRYAAKAYCNWLRNLTGEDFRLPTEAEWEYAAGGGPVNRTKWAGTNYEKDLRFYGNYEGKDADFFKKTAPVKSFKPNRLHIFDMSGNVWEWCLDYYNKDYYQYCVDNKILLNPQNKKSEKYFVLRGGSWDYNFMTLRVTTRRISEPGYLNDDVGFRIAKTLQ